MRRFHYQTIESTNNEVMRLVAEHEREPLLVIADEQTAGRGRRGRQWSSPLGGVWMSIAWPMRRQAQRYDAASLLVALVLRRVLRWIIDDSTHRAGPAELMVKWPNDLLLDGRKVAGVLCERTVSADLSRSRSPDSGQHLIIGVGINANFDAVELPSDLRFPATTLRSALGLSVDIDAVADSFADELCLLMADFERHGLTAPLFDELRSCLAFTDCDVEVAREAAEAVRGRQVGLDEHGRLLIEAPQGVVACSAGEITHLRQAE